MIDAKNIIGQRVKCEINRHARSADKLKFNKISVKTLAKTHEKNKLNLRIFLTTINPNMRVNGRSDEFATHQIAPDPWVNVTKAAPKAAGLKICFFL